MQVKRLKFLLCVLGIGLISLFAGSVLRAQQSVGDVNIPAYEGDPQGVRSSELGTADFTANGRVVYEPDNGPEELGAWEYKDVLAANPSWTEIPTTGVILLLSNDSLRFVVHKYLEGNTLIPSIKMRAWSGPATSSASYLNYAALEAALGNTATISDEAKVQAVVEQNTRPEFSGTFSITIDEDQNPNDGQLVSAIGTVVDVQQGASVGRVVFSYTSGDISGSWQYKTSGSGSAWTSIGDIKLNDEVFLLREDTKIRFNPSQDANTATGTKPSITLLAWDETAGRGSAHTAQEVSLVGASLSLVSLVVQVTITPVNDVPELGGTGPVVELAEDVVSSANAGILVSSIGRATDVDNTDTDIGRAVVSYDAKQKGIFQYKTENGTWVLLPEPSSTQYFTLAATSSIRFLPNANANTGDNNLPTIRVLAWDLSVGGVHSLVDQGGLSTAVSSVVIAVSFSITLVNDPPLLTGSFAIAIDEDQSPNDGYSVSSIGTADDVDNTDIGRVVTGLDNQGYGSFQYKASSSGTWQDISVTVDQYFRLLPDAHIRFNPLRDASTATGTKPSITLLAWDVTEQYGSGTVSISQFFSSLSVDDLVVQVTIAPVNDVPILSGTGPVVTLEEDVASSTNTGLLVSSIGDATDVDNTDIGRAVVSYNDEGKGAFQYKTENGTWRALPAISSTQYFTLAGTSSIRFLPNANANTRNSNLPTIRVLAWDLSVGGAHGLASRNGLSTAVSTVGLDATFTITAVPPRITVFSPARGRTFTEALTTLTLTSDEPLRKPTGVDRYITLYNGNDILHRFNTRVNADADVVIASQVVTLTLPTTVRVPKNTSLYVTIAAGAFEENAATAAPFDSSNPSTITTTSSLKDSFWAFTTGAFTPPALVASVPADGATGVSSQVSITVTFDENIRLVNTPDVLVGTVATTLTVLGNQLTIQPTDLLPSNQALEVRIPIGAVQGVTSNARTTEVITFSFTTAEIVRLDPTNSSPRHGVTGVSVSTGTIRARYGNDIRIGTTGNVYIDARKIGATDFVPIHTIPASSSALSIVNDNTLVITLGTLFTLSANADYQIRIDGSVVNDVGGNVTQAVDAGVWHFTTDPNGENFDPAPPVPGVLVSPTVQNAALSGEIVVQYNEPVEVGSPGNLTLYISGGALEPSIYRVIPVTDPAVSVSGRNVTVKYDNSVPGSTLDNNLPAATSFILVADAGAFQDYSGNGIAAVALNDATWRFTTISRGDNIDPTIVSLQLSGREDPITDLLGPRFLNAATDLTVRVRYSEPVKTPPLDDLDISVRSGRGCTGNIVFSVSQDPTFENGNQELVLRPPLLDNDTQYTVCVASNALSDGSGNAVQALSYTFTTRLARPTFSDTRLATSRATPAPYLDTLVLVLTDAQQFSQTGTTFSPIAGTRAATPFVFDIANTSYNDLSWQQQSEAPCTPTNPCPAVHTANHTAVTLEELLGKATLTTEDIGLYTYYVWQNGENGRYSDTTRLLLVVLEEDRISVRRTGIGTTGDVGYESDPVLLPSVSSNNYHLLFTYNDKNPDYSVSWLAEMGVVYVPGSETVNDLKTIASFVPSTLTFGSLGGGSLVIRARVTLTNDKTAYSYVSSRQLTVSNNSEFSLSYLPATVPPTTPTVDNVLGGICQGGGSYDLVEYISDAYNAYTATYLVNNFAGFEKLSSGTPGFIFKPVSSATSGHNPVTAGYSEYVTASDAVPWRISADIFTGTSIAGETTERVNRFNIIAGVSTVAGFTNVIIYQAPQVNIREVEQKYCQHSPSQSVRVEIIRNGRNNQIIDRRSNVVGDVLEGTFLVYARPNATTDYPVSANATASATAFELDPATLYTNYATVDADSVLIRLVYVSHVSEDVSGNQCIGNGAVEFVIYRLPEPPTFVHTGATTFNNVALSRTEAVYCEDALATDIKGIAIDNAADGLLYKWYAENDNALGVQTSTYTPPPTILSDDVAGDTKRLYTYKATITQYTDGAFRGCESERASAYIFVVGEPEISISSLTHNTPSGSDINLNDPKVCVGRLTDIDASTRDRVEVELLVLASNEKVIITDGQGDYNVSQGGISRPITDGQAVKTATPARALAATEALFSPLLAVQSQDPQATINTPFSAKNVTFAYTWTNVYGGKSCATSIEQPITIYSLPPVGFTAPAEVCVNADAFSITQNNSTDRDPEFYVDNTREPSGQISFEPDEVRRRYVRSNRLDENRYQFLPPTAHEVVYSASDDNGCSNYITRSVVIQSIPELSLAVLGVCAAEELRFQAEVANLNTNPTSLLHGIGRYEWLIDEVKRFESPIPDDPTSVLSPSFLPATLIDGGRDHVVKLIAVANDSDLSDDIDNGCVATSEQSLRIASNPEPKIAWTGITAGSPTDFKLYDAVLGLDVIDGTSFRVEKNSVLVPNSEIERVKNLPKADYLQDIRFTFEEPGAYDVYFSITSEQNCYGEVRRGIEILPLVDIPERGSYPIDFEGHVDGWYADTTHVTISPVNADIPEQRGKPHVISVEKRATSWTWAGLSEGGQFITHMVLNSAKAWFTKTTERVNGALVSKHGYLSAERSWLYTPAFNISNLNRPTVGFNLIYDFKDKDHGLVLQYSTDDGRTWEVLGDYMQTDGSTGLRWYTHEEIDAAPGQQSTRRVGWAASSPDGWSLVRHKLDDIPADLRQNVRFRFALAALNVEKIDSEGVGLDNFWIGDRERVVIVEEFSTEITKEAKLLNEYVGQQLRGGIDKDAMRVTYYGFPKENPERFSDRLYRVSAEDVNARQLFYGITGVPFAVLSGNSFKENSDKTRPSWGVNDLNTSVLERPVATVSFSNISIQNEHVIMTVELALTEEGVRQQIAGEHRLQVIILQEEIALPDSPSGQTVFRNVVRKMLPSAAGTRIHFQSNQDIQSTEVSWRVSATYLNDLAPDLDKIKLYAVAFVQNLSSKTIYQATMERLEVKEVLELAVEEKKLGTTLQVYPNPVSKYVQVSFGRSQPVGMTYQLIDDAGRVLLQGSLLAPTQVLNLDVRPLKQGSYTLVLHLPGGVGSTKRRIFKIE